MSILSKIIDSTREAVAERQELRPLSLVKEAAQERADRRLFLDALRAPGVSIIAEFKRSSPSSGLLGRNPDLATVVQEYERGGASAISILTESTKFGGSQEDLGVARAVCCLPILCKDFVLGEYQVYEAAASGADAVLLIAAVLDEPRLLAQLHRLAKSIGLDALVEIRNAVELKMALDADAELIGINNRDLGHLTVDLETTRRLRAEIPEHVTVVSESGIGATDTLVKLHGAHVDAALIGTALMMAASREETCREFSDATKSSLETTGSSSLLSKTLIQA